jgi:periplasmic protein TonB
LVSHYYNSPTLPWTVSEEDEQRYRRILKRILLTCLLISLVMPWLPLPKVDRTQEELPPRLAKLLLERQPPPIVPAKKPEPEVTAAKPEPAKKEPAKPVTKETKKVEAEKPVGKKDVESARKKASGVGLLALKDDLADLRSAPAAVQLNKDIKPGPGVGAGSGPGVGAGKSAGIPSRALITSNAAGGSGGINTAKFSRDTGGGGLAGRATTLVEGTVGGGGGGGTGGSLQRGGSGKAGRSLEEIKLVFDRNKGAIYTIYNRALRDDPSLQGKVVVKLTIAPSGQVLDCMIVSSELRSPELERKFAARIKQFDFGARNVDTLVVTYPIDFLPS